MESFEFKKLQYTVKKSEDAQQLLEVKEEELLHLWSFRLDQQDLERYHVKQEEEDRLLVKSQEDDEKPNLIQLHQIKTEDNRETERPTRSSAEQMKTEPDGEDCVGPEPDRNQVPNKLLQPKTDEKASDSSETEDSDDYDDDDEMSASGSEAKDSDEAWSETRTPVSGVKNKVGHKRTKKSFSCSECCREFVSERSLQKHVASHSAGCSSGLADEKRSGMKKNVNSRRVTAQTQRVKNQDPINPLQPKTDEKASDSSETEDSEDYDDDDDDEEEMSASGSEAKDGDEDWSETRTPVSGLKNKAPHKNAKKSFNCSESCREFVSERSLQKHLTSHSAGRSSGLADKKRSGKKKNVSSRGVIAQTQRVSNQDPNNPLQPKTDEKTSGSAETEDSEDDDKMSTSGSEAKDGDEDWSETRTTVSGVKNNAQHKNAKKSFSCSECCREFVSERSLQKHVASHSAGRSSGLADEKRSGRKKNVSSRGVIAQTQRVRHQDPNNPLQPKTDENASGSAETEDSEDYDDDDDKTSTSGSEAKDGDEDWSETRTPVSGLKNKVGQKNAKKFFNCSECCREFVSERSLQKHMASHSAGCLSGLADEKSSGKKKNLSSRRVTAQTQRVRNQDLNNPLQPKTDEKVSGSAETEDSDDDDKMSTSGSEAKDGDEDWSETRTPVSGLKNKVGQKNAKKFFNCSECCREFVSERSLQKHMASHSAGHSSGLADEKRSGKKKNVLSRRVTAQTQRVRNQDLNNPLQPKTDENASGSAETQDSEDDDDDDDKTSTSGSEAKDGDEDGSETKTPVSEVKNKVGQKNAKKFFNCSECCREFVSERSLQKHLTSHSAGRSSGLADEKSSGKKKNLSSRRVTAQTQTVRNQDPNNPLQPKTDEKTSGSAETEDSEDDDKMSTSGSEAKDGDEDWSETRTPVSEVKNKVGQKNAKKFFNCSECCREFVSERSLQKHLTSHSAGRLSGLADEKSSGKKKNLSSRRVTAQTQTVRNQDPNNPLQPKTDEKASGSAETEDSEDDDDDKLSTSGSEAKDGDEDGSETKTPVSGVKNKVGQKNAKKFFNCSECCREFVSERSLQKHLTSHSAGRLSGLADEKSSGKKKNLSSRRVTAQTQTVRNQDLNNPLQPKTDEKASGSAETEDSEDDDDDKLSTSGSEAKDGDEDGSETKTPVSGVKNKVGQKNAKKFFNCSECCREFVSERSLQKHLTSHSAGRLSGLADEKSSGKKKNVSSRRVTAQTQRVRNQDPNNPLQPKTDEKTSGSAETEDSEDDDKMSTSGSEAKDGDEDWSETRTPVSGLKNKVGQKNAKKSFSCSECCREFVSERSLQKHVASHSAGRSSGLADEKRSGKKKNVNSRRVTAQTQTFSCAECGKTFYKQSQLKHHMRIHTGQKPFACDQCSQAFCHFETFKVHMMRHSGEKLFHCEVCDKCFYTKVGVKQHAFIHTGLKPFACGICGRCFRLRSDLRVHELSHKGVRQYICGDCGKRFSRQGSLNRHAKLHTEEKQFTCDKCDKKFYQKSHVVSHARVHSGDKEVNNENRPFACKYCKRRFLQKKHLKAHMLVHTGEKRFWCDVCDAKFARPDALKIHKANVHKK